MNFETIFFLLLAGGAVYWYLHHKRANEKADPQRQAPEQATELPIRDSEPIDLFLTTVALEKERTNSAINVARQRHEHDLEARFSDDVKVKERLSKFARDNGLDTALTALWKEIKYYPTWASRNDFDKWKKLHLKEVSGSKDGDIDSVEFAHGDHHFKISERRWYGMETERYSDMSLYEDSEEVFAVSCAIQDIYDTDVYRCHSISAFKKHGTWANVLLEYHAQIQIERDKSTAESKYFRADEIKSRFQG